MEREHHLFQFSASAIAKAASEEAEYHKQREEHWNGVAQSALQRVKETISAKVVEHEVTGGHTEAQIDVDYGDREAWDRYRLARHKLNSHRSVRESLEVAQRVYGSQGDSGYSLDAADVAFFHLGGGERED